MKRKIISLTLAVMFVAGVFSGCTEKPVTTDKQEESLPPAEPVTLVIAGSWEDCRAIEAVGREFTTKYPNCTVEYEYLQNYYESLAKRMNEENNVDLFFTTNIQNESEMLPYALDLNSASELDFSDTFTGLKDNFAFRENGAVSDKLYAIPLGAEMRGLYINKTLLDSLNIKMPSNQAEILSACQILADNGYIPFQGNPGNFSQILMYPWICNIIANADDSEMMYNTINSRDFDIAETFREPYEFLYLLIEKGYYDYKRAQTEFNLFNDTTDKDYACYFLNIEKKDEEYVKLDDVGRVAFMPSAMSLKSVIEKTKEDYHSGIEYVFVPAPIGKDGGYAYMSCAHGIAINKSSQNMEMSVKFMDFLFQPENNKLFAAEFNIIPNTKEAFEYINTLYDIPSDRISHLGQVTFDYDFYNIVTGSLLEISKGNNPKYMQTDDDGNVSLYSLDYYMNNLRESMKENE